MNSLSKRVELLANVAIIIVALLLGAILVKRYLLRSFQSDQIMARPEIKAGTKISLRGIEWEKNNHTLLMVLSKGCRYCTESAPFYKRLAYERAKGLDVQLVAVLLQEISGASST